VKLKKIGAKYRATQIFVNLPVKDLKKSMTFFTKLGFSFNSQFTDETAACLVISTALKSGATETRQAEDYGFMFGRSFNDPDGISGNLSGWIRII
jgi:predicted lactoylglutathione lyase